MNAKIDGNGNKLRIEKDGKTIELDISEETARKAGIFVGEEIRHNGEPLICVGFLGEIPFFLLDPFSCEEGEYYEEQLIGLPFAGEGDLPSGYWDVITKNKIVRRNNPEEVVNLIININIQNQNAEKF